MSLFVTGTDTAVGKTYFSSLLVKTLRNTGTNAVAYKPVACGDRDDAHILSEASGGLDLDLVNPVHLKTPVAPYVAGLLENREVSPAELIAGYQKLATLHPCIIVEGAGGWEVPVSPGYRISDLAESLGLPVLVVAANRLGALNHILLTINAIKSRGLVCAGVVLNQLSDELDTAMITNKGIIEDLSGIPLIDHLIRDQDFIDPDAIIRLQAHL